MLLYRNMDYLKHQFFVYENWPGGIFISPALLGTRPGGAIAAAWASIKALGMDGYLELARRVMDTTADLQKGIRSIPEPVSYTHLALELPGIRQPRWIIG